MTTCHLITYTNLTLLSDVNLSELKDARGKFITDCDCKLFALELRVILVVLLQVVDYELTDKAVGAFVLSPVAELYRSVVQRHEERLAKLSASCNNFSTDVVLHAKAGVALSQLQELFYHDHLEFISVLLELLVNLREDDLILVLRSASLLST